MTNKNNARFVGSELRQTLWQFRREFVVVGIFSMVANLLMLAPTLYMLQVYDRVLVSRSELTLLMVSLITLFLFGVMAFAEWSRSRLLVRAGLRMDALLSTRVFNASFESNLRPDGAQAGRAFADLTELRQFLTGNGVIAFFDIPWTPIYIAVLFFLHPMLGFLAIGFALVQGALAWLGHRSALKPSQELGRLQNDANVFMQSKLRNVEAVESMGMLRNLRRLWLGRHIEAMGQHARTQSHTHRITAISKFVRYVQQSFSLAAGALLVIDGQISPGAMIAANVLMTRALAPIDLLVGTWRGFLSVREAFARLEELLTSFPERDPALTQAAPQGRIRLDRATANAIGRPQPILKDVSFSAQPGQITVVLGPSGSGKSTLARVLVGLWPDVQGEVLLDERPLDMWDRMELGARVGYLPQDVELFDATVAENIARLGDVDSKKVIAAATSAGLHEMILRLPKGYDTPLGEAGKLLSGGQRQRVALARALYDEPVLVVLDEPNANLDDMGEAALQKALVEMRAKGKNIVAITHRQGLVALADQLLVLENGQVSHVGTRDEVLKALRPAPVAASQSTPPGLAGGAAQPA
jgi:ATP-binding cassette subfamily C exporter for protease/lipase